MAYFEFENKNIFYEIAGQGEPLLLLHGNTASSRMFEPVINKYSDNFKTILIDFPGHGKSARLGKFEIDFWYYNSKVCSKLLDVLSFDKVSVIGTSGGALVAINLGLENPELIKFIVADSFEGEFLLNSYIDSLVKDREKGKINNSAKSFWYSNHGIDWEKIIDLDTEMLINFSKLNKSFFHKPISELSVPTLLTGSKQDEFCDHLDLIYADLKNKNDKLEIHLFEKGNHPAMLSNEIDFFDIINRKIIS
jgi:pimeloyl-ACP methyl ester carboxylesterase